MTSPSDRLWHTVNRYHQNRDFDGVVLVARADQVLLHTAFGLAERRFAVPHAPETRFPIASITKQFTALLTMQLVELGQLHLDASLAETLPWYRMDTATKITLGQLLNHTSGLPDLETDAGYYQRPLNMHDIRSVVENHCSGDLVSEPGSTFRYNNADYLVVQAVLEAVSGEDFASLLDVRILKPLDLTDTGLLWQDQLVERLAYGYERDAQGRLRAEDTRRPENYGAAAAMYSTATDLLRWNQALQGDALISADTRERMWTPDPRLGFVALGSWVYALSLSSGTGLRLVDRQGALGGFHVLNLQAPADGISVIVLNNAAHRDLYQTYAQQGMAYELLGALCLE